ILSHNVTSSPRTNGHTFRMTGIAITNAITFSPTLQIIFFACTDYFLRVLFKLASWQHYHTATSGTFDLDIRTQSNDFPLPGTARVLFFHLDNRSQFILADHFAMPPSENIRTPVFIPACAKR